MCVYIYAHLYVHNVCIEKTVLYPDQCCPELADGLSLEEQSNEIKIVIHWKNGYTWD